jgi:ABC-type Fe3+/spermidine/putrescine transport system ATPase subunit
MAVVRLVNLEKRWGDVVGVANQSLEIDDGEFMVFLGPSGCGKTTTMRMVAGLEMPSAGEIWIGDHNVTHALPKDRDVAMVFQNYGLYPHMTVRDNIAYPLKVRGTARAARAAQAEEVARKVELEPSARIVGRSAPKGRIGSCHCETSPGVSDGRAAFQSGCQVAQLNARRDMAIAERIECDHYLRDA